MIHRSMRRLRHFLSTPFLLCLGVVMAGCGNSEPASPEDPGPGLRTTISHGCPDGRDLNVRFYDADGTLEASASCLDPDPMRPERGPGREWIPVADRLRDPGERPEERPRGGLPDADRLRDRRDPDEPRERLPTQDR